MDSDRRDRQPSVTPLGHASTDGQRRGASLPAVSLHAATLPVPASQRLHNRAQGLLIGATGDEIVTPSAAAAIGRAPTP
jgi:hypothetical protein